MTPLVSKDPKDILNAARCFESCVPMGFQNELKTYLLDNAVIAASPPCVTPISPTNLQVGAFTVTNSSISVSWNQPRNTGSLITSYTIQMGTTPGGPYTLQQIVGAGKRVVTFTGLLSGTTYYAILTATSFAGCSVTTAEAHGNTTGNGLLLGVLAYWKMDENVASGPRADATGNGWTATDVTNSIASAAGIINNGSLVDTRSKGLSVANAMDNRAQTAPFTISFWIKASSGGGFWFSGAGIIACKNPTLTAGWLIYPDVTTQITFIHWYTTTDAVAASDITSATSIDGNVFNHIVAGYDGTKKFLYLNGVLDANFPVAVAGVSRQQVYSFGNYAAFGANQGQPGIYDEIGYWNRMLSAANVASLYNGGAALPFSSFS